jgi:hypothetical protein
MLAIGALLIASIVTTPVHVGVHIPNSVTIALPATIGFPTPGPSGGTPGPGGASLPPPSTQAIADDIASQITKQLAVSMSSLQTQPQVSVEYVAPPSGASSTSKSTATPLPNAGGDYVATINF